MFRFDSPFGSIIYDWDGQYCHRIELHTKTQTYPAQHDPVSEWLTAYFNGKSLPLPPLATPNTPFQKKLRSALIQIPKGETLTYGQLAKKLNSSGQGVGQALGANPVPILIPCHRILAAHSLGGFAYGSTWKAALLEFEKD
ncbi:MAG: methylated-DNA--[protein]-cysteine S-methyltransferase [Mariprofundaceae bacterium]